MTGAWLGECHVRILFNDPAPIRTRIRHSVKSVRLDATESRRETIRWAQSSAWEEARRTECCAHTEGQNKAAAHGDHVVVFK
ncbi:MAG: hypothetical protein CM1200mP41_36780 [Gammaproteobacteria bacterium]|nr:MAG: hypothetical protein CM1200mP41_36780 [Gammaproteobacteria bacterium]